MALCRAANRNVFLYSGAAVRWRRANDGCDCDGTNAIVDADNPHYVDFGQFSGKTYINQKVVGSFCVFKLKYSRNWSIVSL